MALDMESAVSDADTVILSPIEIVSDAMEAEGSGVTEAEGEKRRECPSSIDSSLDSSAELDSDESSVAKMMSTNPLILSYTLVVQGTGMVSISSMSILMFGL